ncbi:MAG: CRISPR-associated endonuclease Cas1 [Candidatus Oleimicrobiaceae bacterium]
MPIIPHLIIDQYGAFLGKHSERLQVKVNKDVVAEVPLFGLEQVLIIAGGVSLSSDAVRACAEAGVPISFVSRSGKPYARLTSVDLIGTVQTRRELLLAYADGRGVTLAKAFAQGKLLNQVNLLKYMAKYRKTREQETFQLIWHLAEEIRALAEELGKLSGGNVDAIRPQLLNLEGRAANLYWEGIKRLLLAEVEFRGREQRGAQDVVNVCLNYGYGILYTQVEQAILLAGLDPYAGFVHVDRPGKPSLVLDLIEEFRQAIVDRTVFGLLNKGVEIALQEGRLSDASRKLLAEKVLERLEGEELFAGKRHRLRTILQMQARHIATFVRGERAHYKPFVARW